MEMTMSGNRPDELPVIPSLIAMIGIVIIAIPFVIGFLLLIVGFSAMFFHSETVVNILTALTVLFFAWAIWKGYKLQGNHPSKPNLSSTQFG